MTNPPPRKGRMIAMTDEVDALIDEIANRETRRRRRQITRADLIEEWARARRPKDWVYEPEANEPPAQSIAA